MADWDVFKSYVKHFVSGNVAFGLGIFLLLVSVFLDMKGAYSDNPLLILFSRFLLICGLVLVVVGAIIIWYFKFKWWKGS
jgi:hypothetical protein